MEGLNASGWGIEEADGLRWMIRGQRSQKSADNDSSRVEGIDNY